MRKLSPREGRTWPGYILGGRLRTSTLVLIIAFLGIGWLYDTYEPGPQTPEQVPATEVVPPGFIPDPNYTWAPRTDVQRHTPTTTTPTTTSTTETPATSAPASTPSPAESSAPPTSTGTTPSSPAPTSGVSSATSPAPSAPTSAAPSASERPAAQAPTPVVPGSGAAPTPEPSTR